MGQGEILETFRIASDLKTHTLKYTDALHGKTLAMIFEKPSLRTRVSFDVGIHQLGGFSVCLLPDEIKLGKRESCHDVAKNLERMVQGIMIRTFAHQTVVDLGKFASIPVINGLSDYSHPCQAMADYFTITELFGKLEGLKICFVGDGNNVAHSLMFAGARLGVQETPAGEAAVQALEEDPAADHGFQPLRHGELHDARRHRPLDRREAPPRDVPRREPRGLAGIIVVASASRRSAVARPKEPR